MKTKAKLNLNRETVLNLNSLSTQNVKGGVRDTNEQCPWQITDTCESYTLYACY